MYMKIVKFPEQRNHFIFDLKHGRRDVTYTSQQINIKFDV